jgi:hypothetical protein
MRLKYAQCPQSHCMYANMQNDDNYLLIGQKLKLQYRTNDGRYTIAPIWTSMLSKRSCSCFTHSAKQTPGLGLGSS